MPQSSLMTWLNKPRAVIEPSKPGPLPEKQCKPDLEQKQKSTKLDDDHPQAVGQLGRDDAVEVTKEQDSGMVAPKTSLPPNVDFRSCTNEDISYLKRLTSLLLPIPYPDKFYREIIEDPVTNGITLLAVWHDDPAMKGKERGRLVGAIRCRLFAHNPVAAVQKRSREGPVLYLSTLVLLSPYRSHGIATHLLQILTKRAIEDHGISRVGAHVWVSNAEGRDWYRKRGFQEVSKDNGYYRRLDPQDAVVMQKDIGPSDLLAG